MYDFIVIGAGIAGLAISELLQRSGREVLLLEKNEKICAESSAFQQGWFHTGALYSALPNRIFFLKLVENLENLDRYYRCFRNMNLRVDNSVYTVDNTGWFSNYVNFYAYVSPKSNEVPPLMKFPWWLAILNARRRLASFEKLVPGQNLNKRASTVGLETFARKEFPLLNLGRISCTLQSRDRLMDTHLIAKDLLRSFLGSGGELQLHSEVTRVDRGTVYVKDKEVAQNAHHIVVAAGEHCGKIINGLSDFRIVKSPQAVVYPALTTENFVRMGPQINKTINHLYHNHDGVKYSVVGNASYYHRDDIAQRDSKYQLLRERIKEVFRGDVDKRLVELYDGVKTERVGLNQFRNYQFHIIDTEGGTMVLPGKFSLSFSLAVNFCKYFGVTPLQERVRSVPVGDIEDLVAYPVHYQIAKKISEKLSGRGYFSSSIANSVQLVR